MTVTRKTAMRDASKEHDLGILYDAYRKTRPRWSEFNVKVAMSHRYAELRAAVYAVVPGKQNHRNIAALLHQATLAVSRVIRRRK